MCNWNWNSNLISLLSASWVPLPYCFPSLFKAMCKLVALASHPIHSHIPSQLSHLQAASLSGKHNEWGLNELNEGLTRCWCLSLPWRLVAPHQAAIQNKVTGTRCSVSFSFCLVLLIFLFLSPRLYLDFFILW